MISGATAFVRQLSPPPASPPLPYMSFNTGAPSCRCPLYIRVDTRD